MATYNINTDGTERAVSVVAEEIESLSHELRSEGRDRSHVIQAADAIMHLAADIKFNAEKQTITGEAPGAQASGS